MTKKESTEILKIAKKYIYAIGERGSLERQYSDSADFLETAVWELQAALEAAYNAGKAAK